MGIFQRISDIISANLNELAEGYEDPELMLKQAVREMEESIADATQQTAKAMANEKGLGRELDRNRQQADQWRERAEKAVEAGDDELARKALSRKNEHEKLVAALEDQLEAARDASQALRRQLDGMKAKVAEAKRNLNTLSARKRAADFRKRMDSTMANVSTEIDDNAFAKFERLKNRVEQAEAEAEALSELRGGTTAPPEEPEAADETGVAAELAELKRKLRKDR
ncbi:MAG TPA: PspA/IM30 family protein [Pirellulales bacterium]|nr:PspA/IM30 family protein [Pirellulales bacterium]